MAGGKNREKLGGGPCLQDVDSCLQDVDPLVFLAVNGDAKWIANDICLVLCIIMAIFMPIRSS